MIIGRLFDRLDEMTFAYPKTAEMEIMDIINQLNQFHTWQCVIPKGERVLLKALRGTLAYACIALAKYCMHYRLIIPKIIRRSTLITSVSIVDCIHNACKLRESGSLKIYERSRNAAILLYENMDRLAINNAIEDPIEKALEFLNSGEEET